MASLRRKILYGVLLLLGGTIAILAFAISRDAPCEPAPALAAEVPRMKAVVRRCYGPPEVLAVEEVARPEPAENQVLVRVRAAGMNPLDWHGLRGTPYIMRLDAGFGAPANPRLGVDFAGEVVAVGAKVTRFRPGDAVFGGRYGAFAEYLAVNETGSIAHMPSNLSFEQAGGVQVAALTALQTLRDRAALAPGQKILINGASGGVGSFAVQIAKALGAEVTGVCSTRNVELVRSLGADHVIDYTQEDFTQSAERYDVVMDNVVNRPILEIRRVLKPGGKYLVIGGGGPDANPWIGAFSAPIKAFVISWFVDEDLAFFLSQSSPEDVAAIARLMGEGRITPVVDRTYRIDEIVEAMQYIETGRARGKVVITFD